MKKTKIVIASGNRKKVEEIRDMLEGTGWEVLSMVEAGADIEIIEDGATFEENSYKKALEVMKITGMAAIADDSGLEVDALGGMPGVYSARFAGEKATDDNNNRKLLSMMKEVPEDERTARFVCAATAMFPDFSHLTVLGTCEGQILFEPAGAGGFGYDPLFFVTSYGRTFAELEPGVKNSISHRAKAFSELREKISDLSTKG